MTKGPRGGPRPLVSANVAIQISIIEEAAFVDPLVIENVSSEVLNANTSVNLSESRTHAGQDLFIKTGKDEIFVGLLEELAEVVDVRVQGAEISSRNVGIMPAEPTGPLKVERPLADTSVKIRQRFGIDGEFPPFDVRNSVRGVLESNLVFQSTLASDIGVDFINTIPENEDRLGDRALYILDIVVDVGQQKTTLEEITEIILKTTSELENMGFLIAGSETTVLV